MLCFFFSFFFSQHKVIFSQLKRRHFPGLYLAEDTKKELILSCLWVEFRINVCSLAAAAMEEVHTSLKMSIPVHSAIIKSLWVFFMCAK